MSTGPLTSMNSSETEPMSVSRLAMLVGFVSCYVAYELLCVQADRANKVNRFSVRHVIFEPKDQITRFSFKEFVTGFHFLKFILFLKFTAERSKSFAQLDVGHVSRCQLGSECVQKFSCFTPVGFFLSFNEPLDGIDRSGRPASHSDRVGRETDHLVDLFKVHSLSAFIPSVISTSTCQLPTHASLEAMEFVA